jgi:hypothetical protein
MQAICITPLSCPKRDEQVDWAPFGEDVVLFQKISKQYFVLNTVARRVWELCDGRTSVASIGQVLEGEFSIAEDRAATATPEIVEGLTELGLLAL